MIDIDRLKKMHGALPFALDANLPNDACAEISAALAEMIECRQRIAAAIERSITMWHAHDRARCSDPYSDGYDAGIKRAAEEIRAVLEDR